MKITFHVYSCKNRIFNYTLVVVDTPSCLIPSPTPLSFLKLFGDLFCWGFSSSITPVTFRILTLQYIVSHYKNIVSKRKTRVVVVPGDHLPVSV